METLSESLIHSLQGRHNERHGVSNPGFSIVCLTVCLQKGLEKTPMLRVTGPCEGNPPVTGRPPTKGQWRGKCFHLMTSSCVRGVLVGGGFPPPRTNNAYFGCFCRCLLNKRLSCQWFQIPWPPFEVAVVTNYCIHNGTPHVDNHQPVFFVSWNTALASVDKVGTMTNFGVQWMLFSSLIVIR